jgi:hypothetical protein
MAHDENVVIAPDSSVEGLTALEVINQAIINPATDVDKAERLMAMYERIVEREARTEFMAALARLQESLPQIKKDGRIIVRGEQRSSYATLERIDTVIKPLLAVEGFSFSFDEDAVGDGGRQFSAKLSHKQGHSETRRLTVALDTSGSKNDVQAMGSTTAYARRYLIKMHLNIVEVGEDTDGEDPTPISPEQALDLHSLIDEVGAKTQKVLDFLQYPSIEAIPQREYEKTVKALRKYEEQERNKRGSM